MSAFNTLGQVRRYIRNALSERRTASAIAVELGISKPQVKRLLNTYPGPKVAKQLGIPIVCPLCHRPQRGARRVGDGVYFVRMKDKG